MDKNKVFAFPVDRSVVPDYYDIIKSPMDFSTISRKIDEHDYETFQQFQDDVGLIFYNCIIYNKPETSYARLALRMRKACEDNIFPNAAQSIAALDLDEVGLMSGPLPDDLFLYPCMDPTIPVPLALRHRITPSIEEIPEETAEEVAKASSAPTPVSTRPSSRASTRETRSARHPTPRRSFLYS